MVRYGDSVYSYDAFGNEKSESSDSNPFRYCGEYTDSESGLVYLRARYYDSVIGAFISEDPAKDGLNWYVYCSSDPVNFIDPLGEDAIVLTAEKGARGQGHTSVLVQDAGGVWYYFYWGNKNVVLLEVPSEAKTSINALNNFLKRNGAGAAGEETDMPLHDSNDDYTTSTYIEGDFSASVRYYLNLIRNTTITEDIQGGSHYYINSDYSLFHNNCMQVAYDGLRQGTLPDGTAFGDLAYWDGDGSIRPNDFRNMIRETFYNSQIQKYAARTEVRNVAASKKKFGISWNYYNRGQQYARMIGAK